MRFWYLAHIQMHGESLGNSVSSAACQSYRQYGPWPEKNCLLGFQPGHTQACSATEIS